MAFSFGSVFDAIGKNIGKFGTAIAGGVGAWASIKARKQDIALQQAQVRAQIASIKAQNNTAIANQQAQQAAAVNATSFSPSVVPASGFHLSSIPAWMLVAGALGAFFMMRGAVK